jgi:hypothetical protein
MHVTKRLSTSIETRDARGYCPVRLVRQITSFSANFWATTMSLRPISPDWPTAVDKSRLGLYRKTLDSCNVVSGEDGGRGHRLLVDASNMKVKIDQVRYA